jgi:hypothetical protein
MLNGVALVADVVTENVTVMLQYDGTSWNIIGSSFDATEEDELLVDLGLPSGVKWAKTNIDLTQPNGFAASPFQYECSFFSWGNTDGHNPTSTDSFGGYDWGNTSNTEPYKSSAGNTLTGDIPLSQDAARVNLGGIWRMPTATEFQELFDNCDYLNPDGTVINPGTTNKLVTVNGIVGLLLKSKLNNKSIFFSCSGIGHRQEWSDHGEFGAYWSSSNDGLTYGKTLGFNSGGVSPQGYDDRAFGQAVRPVK